MTVEQWSSLPLPRHDDGTPDGRYTLTAEWTGAATRQWVARFCGSWLGSHADERRAAEILAEHDRIRRSGMDV